MCCRDKIFLIYQLYKYTLHIYICVIPIQQERTHISVTIILKSFGYVSEQTLAQIKMSKRVCMISLRLHNCLFIYCFGVSTMFSYYTFLGGFRN